MEHNIIDQVIDEDIEQKNQDLLIFVDQQIRTLNNYNIYLRVLYGMIIILNALSNIFGRIYTDSANQNIITTINVLSLLVVICFELVLDR